MNRTYDSLKALENENLIRGLAASFADACTHGDAEQFARLWTEDGVWNWVDHSLLPARGG